MRPILSRFVTKVGARLRQVRENMAYRVAARRGTLHPLLPPLSLHSVGTSRFLETGQEFLRHFVDLGKMQPGDRVLDVGCGTGRMALPLTTYLTAGTYDGIDIVAPSIEWCQQTYQPRFANFRFHFADIYNLAYNPRGKHRGSEYRFPFEPASFDFVFLTSVFTHMLPADVENYLSEISRVMRPGARCLITFFLLTDEARRLISENRSSLDFQHEFPGYRAAFRKSPESAVAYEESDVRAMFERHQLTITEPIHFGAWSGRAGGKSHQDILCAVRN